ncbi:outer membrane protein [Sphingomonas immobilis]|uniref:Outer membrane beta-barrel protein n=1 Tax=Sphingomonas immobilis TaxID=3063997 RepID=A0ABT8ZZ70_9SPHN|nr:outer membrane beta-barrel protein [Sphingomonas sp. CA1-15]MDO7842583.1 outer membrane beta-barrel protein [Sphingomonas sp. CA1-15]
MRIQSLFLATAAFVFATPAMAQETIEKHFDGFYAGGTIGFDAQPNDVGSTILFDRNLDGTFGDTVATATGANAFAPSAAQPGAGFCNGAATSTGRLTGCTNDKDNISYSARVGFDKQYGHFVIGALGEFGKSQVRDSVSAFSTTPANYVMSRKVDFNANLRLRAGYAFDKTLFYATGGGAYARINSSFTTTNAANSFTARGDNGAWGLVGGGGIEQKISKHFSIGLEYLYNQYQDGDYRVRVGAGTAPATNPFILPPNTTGTDFRRSDDKFRWHSVRATAQFRF